MSRFLNFLSRVFGGDGASSSGQTGTGQTESRQAGLSNRSSGGYRRRAIIDHPRTDDPITEPRSVPEWVFRPLPLNATRNERFERQIEQLAPLAPQQLPEIVKKLRTSEPYSDFDAVANCAIRVVWQSLDRFL